MYHSTDKEIIRLQKAGLFEYPVWVCLNGSGNSEDLERARTAWLNSMAGNAALLCAYYKEIIASLGWVRKALLKVVNFIDRALRRLQCLLKSA
jgi:hypothetical protein